MTYLLFPIFHTFSNIFDEISYVLDKHFNVLDEVSESDELL
jgi:hypothetical protein